MTGKFKRSIGRGKAGMGAALGAALGDLGLLALGMSATPASAQQPETTVLTGGMLINGLSVPPLHNATVVIRGDRIVQVGPAKEVAIPAGAKVIDTSGCVACLFA